MSSTIRGTNNFDSAWGNAQTWTNVTSSRAINTTYTNSTAAPITVLITTGTGTAMTFIVNGLVIANTQAGGGGNIPVTLIVPAGGTYSVGNTGSISSWYELR